MRLVTMLEAAYILSTTRESIHKWAVAGLIPSVSIQDGGKRLIDLYGYLKSKGVDPEPYFTYLENARHLKNSNTDED